MPEDKKCFSVKEFAEFCGLSEKTIYRRIRDGSIPHRRLGGGPKNKILILPDALARSVAADRDELPPRPNTIGQEQQSGALNTSILPGPKPRWIP